MKQALLWIVAFLITSSSAVFQRMTGPTYHVDGEVNFDSSPIHYSFPRSHGGETNCPIEIQTNDPSINGVLEWKRYKTQDEWTSVTMTSQGGKLLAELPHQPPAGKLQYRIYMMKGDHTISLYEAEGIVIRFKGDVPLFILIPHIITMFGGMLISTRAGLSIFRKDKHLKKLILWTLGLLIVGGFILGPIVQKYAFGAYWTGWPFGSDLTDNKTAIAILSWVIAAVMLKRSRLPERWAFAASVVTLIVYLIPHSLMGSELDYKAIDSQKNSSHVIEKQK